MLGRPALAPDTLFAGQFKVIRHLASGGMGTVYVVEQVGTGQSRALKVMNADLVHDPRSRERFTREAQLAGRIESEHVAQVLGAGIDPAFDTPWILLELLRGEDLSKVLERRGGLPLPEARELLKQLGHALSAAHRQGIVHRDLKPENIFVAESRRSDAAFTVKVLDFGIARWLQENQPSRTTSIMGSPMWMAPEQFDTTLLVSPATDVWALGLVTFAMLAGVPYWRAAQGPSITLAALLSEISVGPLVPASQRATEAGRAGSLPPGFDAWFARCVAREPSERFVDATSAHAALEATFGGGRESVPPTLALPSPPSPMGPAATVGWAPPGHVPTPSGTAVMAPAGHGTPPWMTPGANTPYPALAPTAKRRRALPIALGIVALTAAATAVAGVAWWSSQCDDGYHDSGGHCCRDDATWDRGRSACVATVTPTVTTTVAPTLQPLVAPPPPPPRALVVEPPPPAAVIFANPPSACLGNWSGRISENTGAHGTLRLTLHEGDACGEWRESWETSGLACVYRFVNCRFEANVVRGQGVSSTARCTTPVNATMRCNPDAVTFRESTGTGVVDTSPLRRMGD